MDKSISDQEIEKLALKFVEAQSQGKLTTGVYRGFIFGFKKAMELLSQNKDEQKQLTKTNMTKIWKRTDVDPRFKDLIGERVQCIDKNGNTRIGILEFAGINSLLHGKFQVTISRCPVWPVDPNTLKIYKHDKV